MRKPLIGIVSKHKISTTNSLISDKVKQAVFDNGGVAMVVLRRKPMKLLLQNTVMIMIFQYLEYVQVKIILQEHLEELLVKYIILKSIMYHFMSIFTVLK